MMEIIKFMYFWLIHSNKSIHPERIPVAVKTMNHHFYMAIETPESDKLHLFLLSDGTQIYDNDH